MEDTEDQARVTSHRDKVMFHSIGSPDTEKIQVHNHHPLDSGSEFH